MQVTAYAWSVGDFSSTLKQPKMLGVPQAGSNAAVEALLGVVFTGAVGRFEAAMSLRFFCRE